MINFEMSVKNIKGVGPKTLLSLNRINVFSIEDLVKHFPRGYENRGLLKPIHSLIDGEAASVVGEVCMVNGGSLSGSGKHLTKVVLKNDTGYITGIWFNQRFIKSNFKIGEKYLFYGRVSGAYGQKQIVSPEYEKIEDKVSKDILPVYPSTKNLSQKIIRNIMDTLLNLSESELIIDDILPEDIMKKYSLCHITSALKSIHFPKDMKMIEIAQKRIKFDELLILQLGLMIKKSMTDKNKGINFNISSELRDFVSKLPFKLTNAQKRCTNEVLSDMKSDRQMNRLIQGDVGSGKTIVAVIALFNAVRNGYQGIMMAPTEILASQHFQTLLALYEGWGIRTALLSGKISKKQKDEIKEKARLGEIDILVGTHALIEEDVELKNLGMVITDEQHRFGVRQRAILNQKGLNTDVLVMTATPIPRTMALFIYGDLDISIIDEMPPGRMKVDTYTVKSAIKHRVYNFARSEVSKGRQVYVVCPLIEDSDVLDVQSAVKAAEELENQYLKGLRIGLLHGKMKPDEKDEVMIKFKNGEIDVLVSTTVIEVGINVPNATLMIIENADRFGLAQLHQLRGRVGRGQYKSYCVLICDMKSDITKKRMEIMKCTNDGFKIAEKDMEIRGTGEFFGTRQHGLPGLKLADIFLDADILKITNTLAKELVMSGEIFNDDYKILRMEVERKFYQKSENIIFN